MGAGIEKIFSEYRTHGIGSPLFDISLSGLMLTFRADPAQLVKALGGAALALLETTTQETTQEISSETVRGQIIVLLRQQPSTTRRDLARRLGLSPDGIKYHLDKLRLEGVIRHRGPTKGGRWEVLE